MNDEKTVLKDLEYSQTGSDKWETRNKDLIVHIKQRLKDWMDMDVEGQTKLYTTIENLSDTEQEILQEQNVITKDLAESHEIIVSNTKELEHLADNTCPYCKQQFKETKEKIAECTSAISKANDEHEIATVKLKDCVEDVEALNGEMEKIRAKILHPKSKLKTAEHQIIVVTEELGHAKAAVNGWLLDIETLTEKANPTEIKKLEKHVARLTKSIEDSDVELDELAAARTMSPSQIRAHNENLAVTIAKHKDLKEQTNNLLKPVEDMEHEWFDEDAEKTFIAVFEDCGLPIDNPPKLFKKIEPTMMDSIAGDDYVFIKGTKRSDELHKLADHQQFLLKLLTHKNSFIRKTMLNQTIPFLNKQLDGYLKVMGLPHAVAFTPKMEVNIHRLGKPLQYGNLSNGQQCRVNIALSFAFRDVLEYLHDKINVLVLDEVLDVGLDSDGISSAAAMIKQKAINDDIAIYVISHRDEIENTFDEKIYVELIDGFSIIT